ncbi:MAG: hypothetical protein JST19_12880 [Bacteroidetes bacterium]|nr:hypothetical protein [Bacteroidota bacterium]
MDTEFNKFRRFDSADIEAVLVRIEKSFNIKFDYNSLSEVDSYRALSNIIVSKIVLEQEDTCTTQRAFYLLRNAIAATTGADKCSIVPHSRLTKLFPRDNRLTAITGIEQELGFQINLLKPKQWIITLFTITLLGSSIAFFYTWPLALAGCLASLSGLKLAGKFGKEIHLKTVGDLATKISRESYIKARRNATVNRNEIERKVKELFAHELQLEPVRINRQSSFR